MGNGNLTEEIICGHCLRNTRMKQVNQYSHTKEEDETGHYVEWEVFELLVCPSCNSVTILKHKECSFWDDEGEFDELAKEYIDYDSAREYKTIYPAPRETPVGLPHKVLREYEKAMKYRNSDAEVFATKAGRVLELVWLDFKEQLKNQIGKTDSLKDKLKRFKEGGIIPENLYDVADKLRFFRNDGAHVGDYELSTAELPIIDNLLQAILLYVYSAPFIAKQAEERYERLKGKSSKDGSDSKAPETS